MIRIKHLAQLLDLSVLSCALFGAHRLCAQAAEDLNAELPDAPEVLAITSIPVAGIDRQAGGVSHEVAQPHASVIQAGQRAEPLTVRGKFAIAAHREFGIGFIVSPAISAGYSHLQNSSPHFGTDRAGFGERYGTASFRRGVDIFTTTGVYAALFHDDPRYYVLGQTASIKKRLIYAATRAIITRKDSGGSTVNIPGLLGTGTAQALAVGLYPERDRTASRVLTGTATSIGVDAALFEWSEFRAQIIGKFHKK